MNNDLTITPITVTGTITIACPATRHKPEHLVSLTPEHVANLHKLATWLAVHAEDLAEPYYLRPGYDAVDDDEDWAVAPDEIGMFSMASYAEDYDTVDLPSGEQGTMCNTAACAIGWATHAVRPLIAGESWPTFARSLFGVSDSSDRVGSFMFSSYWAGDRWADEPLNTARRIWWVLEYRAVPGDWGYAWRDNGRVDEDNAARNTCHRPDGFKDLVAKYA